MHWPWRDKIELFREQVAYMYFRFILWRRARLFDWIAEKWRGRLELFVSTENVAS